MFLVKWSESERGLLSLPTFFFFINISKRYWDATGTKKAVFSTAITSPDGDDLAKVQFVIVHLSDEDGCHRLVESRAVHVDCGPDWQHKANDASVNVVVLQEALEGDRQSGRAVETISNKQLKDS